MTKRRREKLEASLALLERVERRLTSQGKQLSKTFYAMKDDVLSELAA